MIVKYVPQDTHDAHMTPERIRRIQEKAAVDPRLARAIARGGALVLCGNRLIAQAHLETTYNIDVGPPTDQKNSGRCWIYGSLNLLRLSVPDYYSTMNTDNDDKKAPTSSHAESPKAKPDEKGATKFSFSQNFVAFWDKFERANYFLDRIVAYRDLDVLDQRMIALLENYYKDGGEWDYFVNIVEKHGIVPTFAMPETTFSGNSDRYMELLSSYLRTAGGRLHKKLQEENPPKLEIAKFCDDVLAKVYEVLCCYLGVPPETFLWRPEKGPFEVLTPTEFYAKSTCDLSQKVHLVDFPFVAYGTRVEVEDKGNVVGANPLSAYNVPIADMKAAARASIKAGDAVVVLCEIKKHDKDKSLLSTDNNSLEQFFRFDKHALTKGDMLRYRGTEIAHLMLLVGCDDSDELRCTPGSQQALPDTMEPLWKFENSHGADGHLLFATDKWMDEYAYGFVVDRKHLQDQTAQLVANSTTAYLKPWDVFGRV